MRIGFGPVTGVPLHFEAPVPDDFAGAVARAEQGG